MRLGNIIALDGTPNKAQVGDKGIDGVVCDLYGLTKDEIAIVEATN